MEALPSPRFPHTRKEHHETRPPRPRHRPRRHRPRRRRRLLAVVAAAPAQADTLICEQFGSTTIQGRYVVQNNRWGTSAQQCINVTATGFTITAQGGSAPTNGAPLSYPSVFLGCHYTNCSPGTNLPIQVSQISSATSPISYTYVGGTYNASYDIWLDPTPRTDGVNAGWRS